MLGSLAKLVWSIVTLPLRLVMLPFKIASFIISVIVYGVVFVFLLALLLIFVV